MTYGDRPSGSDPRPSSLEAVAVHPFAIPAWATGSATAADPPSAQG